MRIRNQAAKDYQGQIQDIANFANRIHALSLKLSNGTIFTLPETPRITSTRIITSDIERTQASIVRLKGKPSNRRNDALLRAAERRLPRLRAELDAAASRDARHARDWARAEELRERIAGMRKTLKAMQAALPAQAPNPITDEYVTVRLPSLQPKHVQGASHARNARRYYTEPMAYDTLLALREHFHARDGKIIRNTTGNPVKGPVIARQGIPATRTLDLLHALDPQSITIEDLL